MLPCRDQTNWTSKQWNKLGAAEVDSYKHKIWSRGEKMMDSIAFEEWALKSLDKELSPKPWASRRDALSKREEKEPLMGTEAGKATGDDDGVVSRLCTRPDLG